MRVLAIGAVMWLAAILLAPFAVASRQPVVSLSGAAIYAGGSRVCHQRAERCFWIHGRPMPVCARCTGLYTSAAVAAPLALVLAGAVSSRRARHITVVAALPTLLTWSLEMAGIAHPSNIVRATAALPLGFAAGWLVATVTRSRLSTRAPSTDST
jgi:uncharacterized membrane protein